MILRLLSHKISPQNVVTKRIDGWWKATLIVDYFRIKSVLKLIIGKRREQWNRRMVKSHLGILVAQLVGHRLADCLLDSIAHFDHSLKQWAVTKLRT